MKLETHEAMILRAGLDGPTAIDELDAWAAQRLLHSGLLKRLAYGLLGGALHDDALAREDGEG